MSALLMQQLHAMVKAKEAEIERLTAELAAAKAQLPAEMQDCTILFKECDKGHGWLTATNWIQHPCPTCELEAAKAMTNQGWDKYCELRKWLADQKYPNMDEEVRAALTDTKE